MPVRGFGREERRLLRHAHAGGGRGADRVDVDRAQQHRGVGVALVDRGRDGRRRRRGRRGVTPGHRGEHAGVEARRVDVAQRRRAASASAVVELGRRHEQREAVGVDEAERAARRASRPRARPRPSGTLGPAACTSKRAAERGRGGRRARRRVSSRWMARTQSWSAASSTTSVMIASAPGSSVPAGARARRGRCTRSRSGGGRRPAPRARAPTARVDRGDALRDRRSRQSSWRDAVARRCAVAIGLGVVGSSSVGEPGASESPQIGSRLARVARSSSRRSLFALGSVRSWGSTPPPSSSSASAPITPVVRCGAPVVAGEVHPVDRERRRVVGDEHAVALPLREASRPRRRSCRGGSAAPHCGGRARAARRASSGSITS